MSFAKETKMKRTEFEKIILENQFTYDVYGNVCLFAYRAKDSQYRDEVAFVIGMHRDYDYNNNSYNKDRKRFTFMQPISFTPEFRTFLQAQPEAKGFTHFKLLHDKEDQKFWVANAVGKATHLDLLTIVEQLKKEITDDEEGVF